MADMDSEETQASGVTSVTGAPPLPVVKLTPETGAQLVARLQAGLATGVWEGNRGDGAGGERGTDAKVRG